MALESGVIVVVFAKTPGNGTAKSRIAAQSDRATADAIYGELLMITASVLCGLPYAVAYADSTGPGALVHVFNQATEFFAQEGNGLGARLHAACEHVWVKGLGGACFVGCDCPEMKRSDPVTACRKLASGTDVVLGPATDGGYYLAGCGRRGQAIFDARGWSTAGLFRETISLAHAAGLSVHVLQPRADIDTLDDYRAWKERPRS